MTQLVSFDSYYNKASVMTVYFRKDLYTCCISSYIIIYIDNVTNMVSFTIYHTYMHPTFSKHTEHSYVCIQLTLTAFNHHIHSFTCHIHSFTRHIHSFTRHIHSFTRHIHSFTRHIHSFTRHIH